MRGFCLRRVPLTSCAAYAELKCATRSGTENSTHTATQTTMCRFILAFHPVGVACGMPPPQGGEGIPHLECPTTVGYCLSKTNVWVTGFPSASVLAAMFRMVFISFLTLAFPANCLEFSGGMADRIVGGNNKLWLITPTASFDQPGFDHITSGV